LFHWIFGFAALAAGAKTSVASNTNVALIEPDMFLTPFT
jgi:hypothetical protein